MKKSTGETDKHKAELICDAFEHAEEMVTRKTASEDRIRGIMNGIIERISGKKVYDPTTRQWFERWLKDIKGTVSDNTVERYEQIVQDFLRCLGPSADRRLESVQSEDIIKFRDQLKAEGRAPQTVNLTIKRVIRQPFTVAVNEGLISRNPTATVRLIRDTDKKEKGTFTPEQITKLIAAAEGDWKGLILAAYYTGGRLGDLVRLRWSNVDLAEKVITFVHRKTEGRSAKARVQVPMHEELEEWLEESLLSRPSSDNANTPVFPELCDMPGAGKSGLSMAFKRIMQKAGIDGGLIRERAGKAGRNVSALSFHSLRHSFTSALANAEVPAEIRQKLTGHSDDKSHQIYTHHELETIRNAVRKIGRLPKGDA